MRRSLPLIVLCLAAAAAPAQASSVSVSPPPAEPNYWEGFSVTVSGVADHDANLHVGLIRGAQACPARLRDFYASRNAAVTPVLAGSFTTSSTFVAPGADPYQRAGVGPGPHTICAHLVPAAGSEPALAVGEARVTLGPDCLGRVPLGAPAVKRLPGAIGRFEVSGQVPWAVTVGSQTAAAAPAGPGRWSLVSALPPGAVSQLKKGLQVYEHFDGILMTQSCTAADGSSAPAPYNEVRENLFAQFRVGPDGDILGPEELPNPTFKGAAALGSILTPAVELDGGAAGEFERAVRAVPAGGGKAKLIGKEAQSRSGMMEVKLTASGKRILAALGKRAAKATLKLETTFTPEGGTTGPVKRSTMKIVR